MPLIPSGAMRRFDSASIAAAAEARRKEAAKVLKCSACNSVQSSARTAWPITDGAAIGVWILCKHCADGELGRGEGNPCKL